MENDIIHTMYLSYKGEHIEVWKCPDCKRIVEYVLYPKYRKNILRKGDIESVNHVGGRTVPLTGVEK